jgi:hypothetical protein
MSCDKSFENFIYSIFLINKSLQQFLLVIKLFVNYNLVSNWKHIFNCIPGYKIIKLIQIS